MKMDSNFRAQIVVPFGALVLTANEFGVSEIRFARRLDSRFRTRLNSELKKAVAEISEYFLGQRSSFTFRISVQGTEFQKKVWSELQKIPAGEVRSYGAIAKSIKKPLAARAVGMANNKNRLPIVIPCHRILGARGDLVGFAAGIPIKSWLLNHEKKYFKIEKGTKRICL